MVLFSIIYSCLGLAIISNGINAEIIDFQSVTLRTCVSRQFGLTVLLGAGTSTYKFDGDPGIYLCRHLLLSSYMFLSMPSVVDSGRFSRLV